VLFRSRRNKFAYTETGGEILNYLKRIWESYYYLQHTLPMVEHNAKVFVWYGLETGLAEMVYSALSSDKNAMANYITLLNYFVNSLRRDCREDPNYSEDEIHHQVMNQAWDQMREAGKRDSNGQ
jgi:hypothetical protein